MVLITLATFVYLYDCYHVYSYLESYYGQFKGMDVTQEQQKLLKAHTDDTFLISRDDFEKRLNELNDELDIDGYKDEHGIFPNLNSPFMKVGREMIVFSGGGRAAFLQLYHPFVAKGVDLHSSLAFGIQRRFYNTFKYMFAMYFGTRQDAFKAASTVRYMHDRVNGEMGEMVGVYSYASKFDAAQAAAIVWVATTLTETMIFEYEMAVDMLTEKEKDGLAYETANVCAMFGIPKDYIPKTYKEFLQYNYAMWNSEVCVVGPTADRIINFILDPPTPIHAPLLHLLRWKTAISMPPRFAPLLLHREVTWMDKVMFAFVVGLIRFVYRLLPSSMRYLTPYLEKEKRYGIQRSTIENILMWFTAIFATLMIAFAMPARDPKKIKASLKELEERKIANQMAAASATTNQTASIEMTPTEN